MKIPEELTERDICPRCGGPLDTGWECLRCGFDAMKYVVPTEVELERRMSDETIAKEDLDVSHYPGKWKVAQELAEKNARTDEARLLPYWERVRLLFLELGGEYKHG